MENRLQTTAHLVGVCGTGMKALAEILLDANWSLSGSDLVAPSERMQSLFKRGLAFHQGHSEANIPETAKCLVYSPAVPKENVERLCATRRHLPQFSYSQMVGQLMRRATGVCLSGTHGKSTTTAMTAGILQQAGRLSAVVLGAESCESGRSGWSGPGDLFVAESCEYQKSFLDFDPKFAVILNVEPDHFDCYPDHQSLQSAFCDFASKTASNGVLLFNADCPTSRVVAETARTNAKRVSFGTSSTADWQASQVQPTATGSQFQLVRHGRNVVQIDLPIFGQHNVMNSLAAAALCSEIGVSAETVRSSLAKFRGIRRRLEFVGQWHGATFVDDYAHHPTAVKIALESLRNAVGPRTIRCIFQPHQILRTKTLMTDFAASFDDANEVLVAPVFAARESVTHEPRMVSQELANQISSHGVPARFCASLDQIVSTLEDATRPGDVIVTMGAGDIDRIHYEFTRRLP